MTSYVAVACNISLTIVKVILDINPVSNGHMLIIPKTHYVNLMDIDTSVLNHIMNTSKELYKKYKDKLNMVSKCDILIDGRFVESEKQNDLLFRGSKSQRIINIQESLKQNKVILWEE